MSKFLKISIGIILLTPLLLFGQNNVVFQSVRLFESGYTVTPQDERIYSTHFSIEETRYIYYELYVKNKLYNVRDNTVTMSAKIYNPDGTLFGENVGDHTIQPEWETAYLWNGYGWSEEGNWSPGTYRIVIYFDNRKVTEALFSIYDKYWTR
jgi:hypothetical protein